MAQAARGLVPAVAGLLAAALLSACGSANHVVTERPTTGLEAAAESTNPVLDSILAALPSDTLIQSATLGQEPSLYAAPGDTGVWLTITTKPVAYESPDSVRALWESWLVEGAYADEAPSNGLPNLTGATYIGGEPPSKEGAHRDHPQTIDPVAGAAVASLEQAAVDGASSLGLTSLNVTTESADGTALIARRRHERPRIFRRRLGRRWNPAGFRPHFNHGPAAYRERARRGSRVCSGILDPRRRIHELGRPEVQHRPELRPRMHAAVALFSLATAVSTGHRRSPLVYVTEPDTYLPSERRRGGVVPSTDVVSASLPPGTTSCGERSPPRAAVR